MTELLQFALLATSAVVVVVDPLGNVPLFLALTPMDTREHRQEMVRRACLVAWALLIAFAVGGAAFFHVLGISLAAFKVAGGLLLLLTAINQLRALPARTRTTAEEQHAGIEKEDVSIVPLAMPLLAGPGSIATVVMLMGRTTDIWHASAVLLAITFALACAYSALMLSERIERILGPMGRLIVERLSGLVLAAFAVQFVLDGVGEALHR